MREYFRLDSGSMPEVEAVRAGGSDSEEEVVDEEGRSEGEEDGSSDQDAHEEEEEEEVSLVVGGASEKEGGKDYIVSHPKKEEGADKGSSTTFHPDVVSRLLDLAKEGREIDEIREVISDKAGRPFEEVKFSEKKKKTRDGLDESVKDLFEKQKARLAKVDEEDGSEEKSAENSTMAEKEGNKSTRAPLNRNKKQSKEVKKKKTSAKKTKEDEKTKEKSSDYEPKDQNRKKEKSKTTTARNPRNKLSSVLHSSDSSTSDELGSVGGDDSSDLRSRSRSKEEAVSKLKERLRRARDSRSSIGGRSSLRSRAVSRIKSLASKRRKLVKMYASQNAISDTHFLSKRKAAMRAVTRSTAAASAAAAGAARAAGEVARPHPLPPPPLRGRLRGGTGRQPRPDPRGLGRCPSRSPCPRLGLSHLKLRRQGGGSPQPPLQPPENGGNREK